MKMLQVLSKDRAAEVVVVGRRRNRGEEEVGRGRGGPRQVAARQDRVKEEAAKETPGRQTVRRSENRDRNPPMSQLVADNEK